jgi:beta-glucuronidase
LAQLNTCLAQKFNDPVFVLQNNPVYSEGSDQMGSRLFKTTSIRRQISLDGFWDFVQDSLNEGETNKFYKQFPTPETQILVPGSWNAIPRFWQFEGIAWYRTQLDIQNSGDYRLVFGGVFYMAKIWIDGKFVGEHEGGYSPFSFIINNLLTGKHELIVKVDNLLSDHSLPMHNTDWFPYGGITRPVYIESINSLYINKLFIINKFVSADSAEFAVQLSVTNRTGKNTRQSIQFFINGNIEKTQSIMFLSGLNDIEFHITYKHPALWSCSKPSLYLCRALIGDNIDDQYERIGIRKFSIDGNKILLNGERFIICGVNHHDDHPDWGSALPSSIIRNDIEIIKRLYGNTVRCHYPPSELFMDMCDLHGLVFMSEIPCWQFTPEQLSAPIINAKIRKQFEEMVSRDMNHPCIMSWSLGNEWTNFDKAYDQIKELVGFARKTDNSHFITFISGGAEYDKSTELLDIVCTNWTKFDWYKNETIIDQKAAELEIKSLLKLHENFPDKPVVITEFGHGESMAGWHNWGNVKWSEEYQAMNVYQSAQLIYETEWLSGGCVWQFCNTRSTPKRILAGRLKGWNSKGIVDEYRFPKSSFYLLQEIYRQQRLDK